MAHVMSDPRGTILDQNKYSAQGEPMRLGSTHIIRCPHCSGLGCYEAIKSGNSFGAKFYTDGKEVAPMMPEVPAVVECASCTGLFWLGQQEEVGEFDAYGDQAESADPAWKAAGKLHEPGERQYLVWLERLRAEQPARERDLRMFTWWRGNDRHRDAQLADPEDRPQDAASREANMRALCALLQKGVDGDRLMRAEILRQLGQFDDGLAVLSSSTEAHLEAAAKRLRSLCEAGDREVRPLF